MPLVRCDYNTEDVSEETIKLFVNDLLNVSMEIWGLGEDYISIFTSPYQPADRSTAAMEIEYRVGAKEFIKENETADEVHERFLSEVSEKVKELKTKYSINKGIVLTITKEDWKPNFLE